MTNIDTYTQQCIFNPESSTTPFASSGQIGSARESAVTQARMWEFYEALYLIVQTYFVLLTVINIISLLEWQVKLVTGPCRRRVSSCPDLTADACFLMYMAGENAGPEVVRAFVQSGAWGRGEGKESIAQNE
ncbi:pannexin 8 [Plakobranchus ocellatus]|uniref:Pannexin 8 n=1 Tax=Plakobranchus ocellatus TaxID=259542 RepID=A0AAV3YYC4_9GAST|nr:pannexin 8 [Plakobranchus ocellatus]